MAFLWMGLSRIMRLTEHFLGSPPQKGIVTYALSGNRQRPLAGALNAAIFNTYRRTKAQILYWAPPMIIAYLAMDWAVKKYVILSYCSVIGDFD